MHRPLRIVLVKPFQPVVPALCQPPLGLLQLAGGLRERFGDGVQVELHDLRLDQVEAEAFAAGLAGPVDVLGVSALNFEAQAAVEIAAAVRRRFPDVVTALGGPYAHSSEARARADGVWDWIFHGEADRAFAALIAATLCGDGDPAAVAGVSRRLAHGDWQASAPAPSTDRDLDDLPRPAWDLVRWEVYPRRPNMNGWLKGRRYAPLFTSRGCPYHCSYCHDLFGKGFRWQSADRVVEEIAHLHEAYAIDEFQIIDDIFNLHKPRMRDIARRVIDRFGPRRLHFCFPNGIRADILDEDDLPLLADMGVYQMAIAIETVTERLQAVTQKNLRLERIPALIAAAERVGIRTKGFFMIGFPTETLAEIEATVRFAVKSELTFAGFYMVIPQEGTPMHALASRESASATAAVTVEDFYNEQPWYQLAYDVELRRIQKRAFRRFYLRPKRIWRIVRNARPDSLLRGAAEFARIALTMDPVIGRRRASGSADGMASALPA